ncbi:MAG: Flp pilus assembly protein CpaB [Gaiellaceae bacterium]
MTYRARNTAIAGALAALAVLLTMVYVHNVKSDAQEGSSLVRVMVAVRDIVAGTPGSEASLQPREVPRRTVVPGAIANQTAVAGLVATDQIYAGEQVTTNRFAPLAEQGVVGELKGTERAFQVPGDEDQVLAGTLKVDDRIDVVASIKYRVRDVGGSTTGADLERTATRIVLRDLRVLRAPEAPSTDGGLADSGASAFNAILAVTDSQAQKLFYVLKNGDWSLQLRPKVRPKDSPESVETVESVLGDGLKLGQKAQLTGGWARGDQ